MPQSKLFRFTQVRSTVAKHSNLAAHLFTRPRRTASACICKGTPVVEAVAFELHLRVEATYLPLPDCGVLLALREMFPLPEEAGQTCSDLASALEKP